MAVGSILILCVFLVSVPLGAGDVDSIQMIIKHETRNDNFIVNFSLTNFKRFYNCMCPSAWTKCIAELENQSHNEQRVSKVNEASINTRESAPRYFTCFHNATSEVVICSMLFDNDGNDDDDDDDDDDYDIRSATEWFQLRRENCDCVGIKWMHSGETIFSKNNKTSLRRLANSCEEGNPPKRNTVLTKASTTLSSWHRKRKELSGEDNAQDDKLWIIITTVVVILVVIIVVLLFIVLKCGCRLKNYLTKSRRGENATNLIINNSVTYTLLEHPVLTEDNNVAGLTQSKNPNINHIETEAFHQSGTIALKQTNPLCDDTELCYVDIHDAEQHFQKDDNYDVIEDDEKDDEQKVKVAGLEALGCTSDETVSRNVGQVPQDSSGEDDVYEGYEDRVREGRFPDVMAGSESQKKIQEGTLYSSADGNCEINYTSVVFQENTLVTATTLTDNSYEEMGTVIASSNNHIRYEDMSMDTLPKSEQKGNDAIIFHGDANSEEHYHPREISNTPGIGDDAASTPVYSTLGNEICKRTHTYDVLHAKDVEPM